MIWCEEINLVAVQVSNTSLTDGYCWALFFWFGKSKLANSWRCSNISLDIYFMELPNITIWQARNSKLLEML